MNDYKEVWQHWFEVGTEDYAMSEEQAGKYADHKLVEHYADRVDDARMRAKEGGL